MNDKINIKGLNFYYGDKQALKNVNLTVREKEITAQIGRASCRERV